MTHLTELDATTASLLQRTNGTLDGPGVSVVQMPSANAPNSNAIVVVSLRWNGEPLTTRAVTPGETVVLGDAKGALAPLPEEALGRATVVVADREGGPHLCVPDGKVASITDRKNGLRLIAGPQRVALAAGEEARMLFGLFELSLAVESAEPAPRRRRMAAGAWAHMAAVAAVHAALLVASSRAALASSIETDGGPDVEAMRGYLAAAEERSSAQEVILSDARGEADAKRTNGRNGNGRNGGGERHAGEAGKAGATSSRAQDRHYGAAPVPEKGLATSAASAIEEARNFGMVGLLRSAEASPFQRAAEASPWGATDAFDASGGLLGRLTGESGGVAGLTLSGTGEGGGGRGEGIGLGTIGTIGHADGIAGLGTGGAGTSLSGVGFGHGGRGGGRQARSPSLRWGEWFGGWIGRLPAEIVQRTIRANFGRFRACYESGLRRNPTLAGRVSTSFVIGRDGAVSSAANAGSDLRDAAVVSCVVRAFYGISFPQPEDGIVTVTYPIVFTSQQ
jgi:hypothetical protein